MICVNMVCINHVTLWWAQRGKYISLCIFERALLVRIDNSEKNIRNHKLFEFLDILRIYIKLDDYKRGMKNDDIEETTTS